MGLGKRSADSSRVQRGGNSVTGRDYSVTLGITVLVSIIIILANLVVDILYGYLDPRTRELRT